MGRPMTFKTGAVVGSYPKPLLVLEFDQGGLSLFPTKGQTLPSGLIKTDVLQEDITWIKATIERSEKNDGNAKWHTELWQLCNAQPDQLSKVTAIDFHAIRVGTLTDSYTPKPEEFGFKDLVTAINFLQRKCPWKTVVLDTTTGLTETILSHMAQHRAKRFEDARKWAPDAGYQVVRTVSALSAVQAHLVCIIHDTQDRGEDGVLKGVHAMIPSQWARERLGGITLQNFYAARKSNVPIIHTTDFGYVTGLGAKWPLGLPSEITPPTFDKIYETEKGLLL